MKTFIYENVSLKIETSKKMVIGTEQLLGEPDSSAEEDATSSNEEKAKSSDEEGFEAADFDDLVVGLESSLE